MISYKVIALILEPYKNAMARGNNAESIAEPLKEPVTDVNRDYDEFDPDLADSFDFDEGVPENDRQDEEFNQGEESHQNKNEEELSQKQNEEENKPEFVSQINLSFKLTQIST